MTLSEVRNAVGSELALRLRPLQAGQIGLYYDTIPSGHERLVVRFWFPVYGSVDRGYEGETVERPILQIDVKHYPPSGGAVTPSPEKAEILWGAVKLEKGVMKLHPRPIN